MTGEYRCTTDFVMAGSYRHVTDTGAFRGIGLLDHLGDAAEALEEMHAMIGWLAHGDRALIAQAISAVYSGRPPIQRNVTLPDVEVTCP